MARIALLSTSDTDLLSARACGADYLLANPSRLEVDGLEALLSDVDLVVVRLLGTPRSWQDGFDVVLGLDVPVIVLGGEQTPDASLMELSTVPVGTAAEAHAYLAHGGPANLANLHAFCSDTVLLTGEGFEPPMVVPEWGWSPRPSLGFRQAQSSVVEPVETPLRIGVLFYRAHETSGNAGFAHALADAIDAGGEAVGLPIFSSSLRSAPDELFDALGTLDALIVTVLAAGGSVPSSASAGGDDEGWDVERIKALDIPVLQGLCLTSSREEWAAGDDGVTPLDSANQIAIPEFDGRIITVPFSFKEIDADGLPRYVADPERASRVAGIAVAHARLRRLEPKERRIALVLSAYPTKHSRVGNAVGLDTPVSAIRLLRRLRDAGYDIGDGEVAALVGDPDETAAGNRLIHALIEAGGQDEEWLTTAALTDAHARISADDYLRWTADLPADLRAQVEEAWGPAPGTLFVNGENEIVLATLRAGNV